MEIMVNARVENQMPITSKEMTVFALANKLKVYIEGNNIIVHKLLINLRMKYMVKKNNHIMVYILKYIGARFLNNLQNLLSKGWLFHMA